MSRLSVLFLAGSLCACAPEQAISYSADDLSQANELEDGLSDDFGDTMANADTWIVGQRLLPGQTGVWSLQGVNQTTTDVDVVAIQGPQGARVEFFPHYDATPQNQDVGISSGDDGWNTAGSETITWFDDSALYARMSNVDQPTAWTLDVEVTLGFDSPSIDWTPYFAESQPLEMDAEVVEGSPEYHGFTVYEVVVSAHGALVEWDGAPEAHLFDAEGNWLQSDANVLEASKPGIHYAVVAGSPDSSFHIAATQN